MLYFISSYAEIEEKPKKIEGIIKYKKMLLT